MTGDDDAVRYYARAADMTEDEARAVVATMRRDAWLIAIPALAVNLALITWNLTWGSAWWVPVHLVATAVIVYGIRRLIELERRGNP